jgi:hypothetical protein
MVPNDEDDYKERYGGSRSGFTSDNGEPQYPKITNRREINDPSLSFSTDAQDSQISAPSAINFDDIPIKRKEKTFEEMIQEELLRNGPNDMSTSPFGSDSVQQIK